MPVEMEKAEGQAEHRGDPGALLRRALIERCLLLTRDAPALAPLPPHLRAFEGLMAIRQMHLEHEANTAHRLDQPHRVTRVSEEARLAAQADPFSSMVGLPCASVFTMLGFWAFRLSRSFPQGLKSACALHVSRVGWRQ